MRDDKSTPPPGEVALAAMKPRRTKTFIAVALLMLLEGAGILSVTHFLRPQPATAMAENHEMMGESNAAVDDALEIQIGAVDAVNSREGRPYVYHFDVSALIHPSQKDACKQFVDARGATIRDRLDTVVRNSDPKFLSEPGLETLRRQIKFELDKISKNEKLFDEILITKFLKTRANL